MRMKERTIVGAIDASAGTKKDHGLLNLEGSKTLMRSELLEL